MLKGEKLVILVHDQLNTNMIFEFSAKFFLKNSNSDSLVIVR